MKAAVAGALAILMAMAFPALAGDAFNPPKDAVRVTYQDLVRWPKKPR